MARHALRFLAGRDAAALLRRDGFSLDRFDLLAGASGGPKWLVLSRLDRVLVRCLEGRSRPLSLVGSSIGAWRFTCYGMPDAPAAIDRFEDAYVEQRYSRRPSPQEVSRVSREILAAVTGGDGAAPLGHPWARLHAVVVRCRAGAQAEGRWLQGAAVVAAAAANLASPRALGLWFERVLFSDPRDERRLTARVRVDLTPDNLEDAVMASGSIPLVLEGVRDIAGAPPGTYRDGGVTDYHLHTPLASAPGLVLYPHFAGHLAPGWFDKRLPWRRADADAMRNMLLVFPDPAFVARLPRGRIPDRTDFHDLDDGTRIAVWRRVIAACARLADELEETLDSGDLGDRLEQV